MKLLILITLFFCAAQINAKDLNKKDVPEKLKVAILKTNAVKKPKWNKDGDDFEASFKKDGKEKSIVFSSSGEVINKRKHKNLKINISRADRQYYCD